jgi:hypothetical protein
VILFGDGKPGFEIRIQIASEISWFEEIPIDVFPSPYRVKGFSWSLGNPSWRPRNKFYGHSFLDFPKTFRDFV